MPGYMLVHGQCVNCQVLISFNATHVPSIRVKGKREPLCRTCFTRWNEIHRPDNPLPIHPDAYEPEPCVRVSEKPKYTPQEVALTLMALGVFLVLAAYAFSTVASVFK